MMVIMNELALEGPSGVQFVEEMVLCVGEFKDGVFSTAKLSSPLPTITLALVHTSVAS